MKAKNIINSITSILNEDMYAKYTLTQLFYKLGNEEFDEYLEKFCTKIIRGLDTETNIKNAKPIAGYDTRRWEYAAKTGNLAEHLEVRADSGITISYYVNGNFTPNLGCGVSFYEVGYAATLEKALNKIYNSKGYKELREKYK